MALYEAWRGAGISLRRLARDLYVVESEVRLMLSPDRTCKATTIGRALSWRGKRLIVNGGEAV